MGLLLIWPRRLNLLWYFFSCCLLRALGEDRRTIPVGSPLKADDNHNLAFQVEGAPDQELDGM